MSNKHDYYHNLIQKTLNFIIPQGSKVLFWGVEDAVHLSKLKPEKATVVGLDKKELEKAKKKYGKYTFHQVDEYSQFKPLGNYDYIILNGVLGKTINITGLLNNLQSACTSSTRIIIYQHNYLWQWILNLAEKMNLKTHEGIYNWLSLSDVSDYLKGSGFEVTRVLRRTLFPIKVGFIGPLINTLADIIPFFDYLKIDQYLIARPEPSIIAPLMPASLTICITVRNEKENIESIIKNLPVITDVQEILFVEGHSTDGTRKEIIRIIKKYPQKNIRVIGQPGKGQGDAIRVGYKEAKGDIIILYEGDGTSDPDDIKYFYEAAAKGRYEFIEGSRFVYPFGKETMPMVKQIGNIFFAKWFSFVLGQRSTDVLSGIKVTLKRDYDLIYKRWGFLGYNDPFGDFELLYGSARMGLKIGEIPMRYYPRTYGQSHSQIFKHGIYLIRMAIKGYWTFRNN